MAKTHRLGYERRQAVLDHVKAHGSASVAALGQLVGASPATVHRDLDRLAREGLIERVRGGAIAPQHDDPPVSAERARNVPEKKAIAKAAASLIEPNVQSIFLEASTTVAHLVPHLKELEDVVLVTNSPELALELSGGAADVVIIGGHLRQRTLSTVGPQAISALNAIAIDVAFIGISALSESGLSSMNAIEAETKSAVIESASRVIGLTDSSKLGRRALAPVAPLTEIDMLVTDSGATEEALAWLRKAGVEVVVAEQD